MIYKIHSFILAAALLPFAGVANAETDDTTSSTSTLNSLQLGYSLDRYSRTFEDNPITTLQYGRTTFWGSLSLRASSTHRYQSHDAQYEIDLYPRLWEGAYAYLNLGTSYGDLFPLNRQGAELFSSLGNGFEGSIGARHLAFQNSAVSIYTGSLSKYFGDYLFTVRPYITPSNTGTSFSTSIKLTRYFADANEYVRVSASAGKSLEEHSVPPVAVTLKSRSLGLSGQWSPRTAIFISPSYTRTRQELLFAPGEYVEVNSFSAAISYRF